MPKEITTRLTKIKIIFIRWKKRRKGKGSVIRNMREFDTKDLTVDSNGNISGSINKGKLAGKITGKLDGCILTVNLNEFKLKGYLQTRGFQLAGYQPEFITNNIVVKAT